MSSTSPRDSYEDQSKRDIPSFIEPRPPVILHPFMRSRPEKGTNLMDLLEDSEYEEPDLLKVYLRLKPCNVPSKLYEVRSERTLITSLDTTTAGHGRRTQHNVSKMYTFSHIFGPDSTQKEIFEQVVKDNLKKLPDGNSFTLLTYGASGSGKTFTLMGTVAAPGLVPRSLEYVFKVVDAAQRPLYKPDERGTDTLSYAEQEYELRWVRQLRQISAPVRDKYRRMSAQLGGDLTVSGIDLANRRSHYVWVSFIEIYNEGIYDLLAAGDKRSSQKLAIREDSGGNVYVKGATQAFVRSGEEAYDVLVAGKHNLQVAATGIHAQSSRSHCIFTITMLTETEGGMRSACVRLCDLAGCERAARTRNTGARMQESRAINSSLHVLERCLRTLRRKRTATTLVPYRESKLTRLLGAGLSGTRGEAVSMVVTLNPSPEYANETRHVLQLAAVAKDIQINDTLSTLSEYPSTLESTQDATIGYNIELMKLRADNERLLFELEQAQARNEELIARMEQCKAENEKAQWMVLKDSEAMYKEFYEAQLEEMRTKMDELVEEYESRLSQLESGPSLGGSPSTDYQKQIAQLMTDNAILQEKLSAERLARATAEQEVQHLRACIDERDEKADGPTSENEDVVSLTDSDTDSDSDREDNPYNQSLEPTIRKEDINRSRMLRKSFMIAEHQNSFNPTSDESDSEKSLDNIKENDKTDDSNVSDTFNESVLISTVKKGTNLPRTKLVASQKDDIKMNTAINHTRPVSRDTFCVTNSEDHETSKDVSQERIATNDKYGDVTRKQRPLCRDTFCVTKSEDHETSKDVSQEQIATSDKYGDVTKTQRPLSRDTFFVTKSEDHETSKDISQEQIATNDKYGDVTKTQRPLSRDTFCVTKSEDHETSKDESQEQIAINDEYGNVTKTQRPLSRDTFFVTKSEDHETSKDISQEQIATNDKYGDVTKTQRPLSRDTFCVTKSEDHETSKDESQEQIAINDKDRDITKTQRPLSRETYCVTESKNLNASNEQITNNDSVNMSQEKIVLNEIEREAIKAQRPLSRETYCVASSESLNISKDSKLHEHSITKSSNVDIKDKRMTSLKPDPVKFLNVSKGCNLNKKDESSLNSEMTDIKLLEKNFRKSKIGNSVKVLNISYTENNESTEKNDISKISDVNKNSLRDETKTDISVKSKVLPNTYVKKLIDNIKQSTESNESLVQFERLEMEAKLLDTDTKRVTGEFYNIKLTKEHKNFFDEDYHDECPKTPATVIKNKDKKTFFENPKEEEVKPIEKKSYFANINADLQIKDSKTNELNDYRSSSIVKDEIASDFRPSIIKKLLGKNITKSRGVDSCDLFEEFDSPRNHNKIETDITNSNTNNVAMEVVRKSIDENDILFDCIDVKEINNTKNISIEILEKKPIHVISIESSFELAESDNIMVNTKTDHNDENNGNKLHETLSIDKSQLGESCTKGNNTTVEFENIFKDVTEPRATDFDLLISQDSSKSAVDKLETTQDSETEKSKYNLRRKTKFEVPKTERKRRTKKVLEEEVLLESHSKCESSKKPPRKNLRLRRQKNVSEDNAERDKLTDIVNLQTEFSDVTMDLPAPVKITKDIPSPEKLENDENTSPIIGIRSCPAKSITRSRRKLFTPRAEPLDESAGGTGDSDQRVRVPRPSYHRPRARRKL